MTRVRPAFTPNRDLAKELLGRGANALHPRWNPTIPLGGGAKPPALWLDAGDVTTLSTGGSRDFNGSNNYFDDGGPRQLSGVSFSVACWVNPDTVASQFPILAKWDTNSNREWMLYHESTGGAFRFTISESGNFETSNALDYWYDAPAIGKWFFITAGYDASSGRLFMRINDGPTQYLDTASTTRDGTAKFAIGAWFASGAFSAGGNGQFAKAGVWRNYVITEEDHVALFNNGRGLNHTDLPASLADTTYLKGYWNLNEAGGNALDSSEQRARPHCVGYATDDCGWRLDASQRLRGTVAHSGTSGQPRRHRSGEAMSIRCCGMGKPGDGRCQSPSSSPEGQRRALPSLNTLCTTTPSGVFTFGYRLAAAWYVVSSAYRDSTDWSLVSRDGWRDERRKSAYRSQRRCGELPATPAVAAAGSADVIRPWWRWEISRSVYVFDGRLDCPTLCCQTSSRNVHLIHHRRHAPDDVGQRRGLPLCVDHRRSERGVGCCRSLGRRRDDALATP